MIEIPSNEPNPCDLLELLSFLGKKWSFMLLTNIKEQPISYNELYALSSHRINPTLLSERLKEFVRFDVVERKELPTGIIYCLTPEGARLKQVLHELKQWVSTSGNIPPSQNLHLELICTSN